MKVLKTLAMLIALTIVVSSIAPALALTQRQENVNNAFIDPRLLDDSTYNSRGVVSDSSFLMKMRENMKKIVTASEILTERANSMKIRPGQARVVIIATPAASIDEIASRSRGIITYVDVGATRIIVAWATKQDVLNLAKVDGVSAILPDVAIEPATPPGKDPELVKPTAQFTSTSRPAIGGPEPTSFFAVNITGARNVWERYGLEGANVTIGIIDTGVDYGSPALGLEAIAREPDGTPKILDDGLGLAITNVTVTPNATGYFSLNTTETPVLVYDPMAEDVYYTNTTWVLVYNLATGVINYTEYNLTGSWYVGNITSAMPMKFGLQVYYLIAYPYILYFSVPLILVDERADIPGYDTVYMLVNDTYQQIRSFILGTTPPPLSYSFAGEEPITYGHEVAGLDTNGDGYYDFSLGTLAGYAFDAYGIIHWLKTGDSTYLFDTPWNYWTYDYIAQIYPGIDHENGTYVTLEYDFYSHGTQCAATAAGRHTTYYLYSWVFGLIPQEIPGQAPAAKIAAANALWAGDTMVALLWMAGYDFVSTYQLDGASNWVWTYSGEPRVDITSNSYGISTWFVYYFNYATSYDPYSQLFDYVSMRTGVINVIAGGNGGHGFGTTTTPGSSLLSITTAASTEFYFRPYLYGYISGGYDDIIPWSNRGPVASGLAKPDVAGVGAYAFAGGRTWEALYQYGDFSNYFAYDLFGGTSEATPMTAGAIALMIQAYKVWYASRPTPDYIKTILKSTADDLGYGPFDQGSGRINVEAAVKFILERKGLTATSNSPYTYYRFNIQNLDAFGEGVKDTALRESYLDTSVYFGDLLPGESATKGITLFTRDKGTYLIKAYKLELTNIVPICDILDTNASLLTYAVNCTDDTIYMNLTAWQSGSQILAINNLSIFQDADLVAAIVSIPLDYFAPNVTTGNYTQYVSWFTEFGVAVDVDGSGNFSVGETARLNIDYRDANAHMVTIGKPMEKFMKALDEVAYEIWGIPLSPYFFWEPDLRLYMISNEWFNKTVNNQSVIVPFHIDLYVYKRVEWDWITPGTSVVSGLNGFKYVPVTISIPSNATPGLYSGYIAIERVDPANYSIVYDTVLMPVSVNVMLEISNVTDVNLYPSLPMQEYYPQNWLRIAYDWGWREESGDWRVLKVKITNSSIGFLGVYLAALGDDYNLTNLDVAIIGPNTVTVYNGKAGKFVTYSVNGYILGANFAYRSRYYQPDIPPQPFFPYPIEGTSIVMAPISGEGVYTILYRATIEGGESGYYNGYEPVALYIRTSAIDYKTSVNVFTGSSALITGKIETTVPTWFTTGNLSVGYDEIAIFNGQTYANMTDNGIVINFTGTAFAASGPVYVATFAGNVTAAATAVPGTYEFNILIDANVPQYLYGNLDNGTLMGYVIDFTLEKPATVTVYSSS